MLVRDGASLLRRTVPIKRSTFFRLAVANRNRFREFSREKSQQPGRADGKSLFVLLRGQVPAQVYQVDIATGHRTLWKAMEPADSAGIDTIGRGLHFDRQQGVRLQLRADPVGFISRGRGCNSKTCQASRFSLSTLLPRTAIYFRREENYLNFLRSPVLADICG